MSAAPAMHPARAMGAREGTGPEDNPLMRSHGARARMKGHAQGHREGFDQDHLNAVVQVLEARGIAVALDARTAGRAPTSIDAEVTK